MCFIGDGVRVPLCGMLLLFACCTASKEPRGGDMAVGNFAQLPGGISVDALCDEYLLVHYYPHNGGVRRSAPRQQGGDGVRHILHVDELSSHSLHYWKHDQSDHTADGAHPSFCKYFIPRHTHKFHLTWPYAQSLVPCQVLKLWTGIFLITGTFWLDLVAA